MFFNLQWKLIVEFEDGTFQFHWISFHYYSCRNYGTYGIQSHMMSAPVFKWGGNFGELYNNLIQDTNILGIIFEFWNLKAIEVCALGLGQTELPTLGPSYSSSSKPERKCPITAIYVIDISFRLRARRRPRRQRRWLGLTGRTLIETLPFGNIRFKMDILNLYHYYRWYWIYEFIQATFIVISHRTDLLVNFAPMISLKSYRRERQLMLELMKNVVNYI